MNLLNGCRCFTRPSTSCRSHRSHRSHRSSAPLHCNQSCSSPDRAICCCCCGCWAVCFFPICVQVHMCADASCAQAPVTMATADTAAAHLFPLPNPAPLLTMHYVAAVAVALSAWFSYVCRCITRPSASHHGHRRHSSAPPLCRPSAPAAFLTLRLLFNNGW
jgi:hypothetical protein